jgi:short-subunit dehydrogenase
LFAKVGAKVMLTARRKDNLIRACEEICAKGGQADYYVADIAVETQAHQLVQHTHKHYGRVDVLVNNAGYGHFLKLANTTSEDMHKIMEVNFFGTFYATQAVLPIMQKQQSGQIIMVSSVAGKRVFGTAGGAYNVSKYAMQSFAEALRMELLGSPIKVSIVCPVVTTTEFFDIAEKQIGKKAPLKGPVQSAQQVAETIVSLIDHPKPEVMMLKPVRILLAINAFFPGLIDHLIQRFMRPKE